MEKTVAILGITGSVGMQAADVAEKRGYSVDFMSANSDSVGIEPLARKFLPKYVAMADENAAKDLSVHPKERYLPVTIVSDGCLLDENLAISGRDGDWLRKTLGDYRATVASTWLLTVDKAGHVLWLGKE